jgi:hypothetical protein
MDGFVRIMGVKCDGGAPPSHSREHSEELDVISHLVSSQTIGNEQETADNLADGSRLLMAVNDASMLRFRSQCQEILVMRENYSLLGDSKSDVRVVASANQPYVGGHGHIDATTPEAICNCRRDIFIQVEAEGRHSGGA